MAGHGHHHVSAKSGDGRVALAIVVNVGLTVAQIVGGILSGSLALIADAIHNLSDAGSLGIAFAARRIARRDANSDMTFGFARVEIVAALANYTTLILIGLFLAYEGVMRFLSPEPVIGWVVVVLAGVALLVDSVTALLTYAMSRDSVNIRAAFVHNLADALGSVAVMFAGTLILLFGWLWVDPLVTLMIAGYILWLALREVRFVIRILMLGTPPGIEPADVAARIVALPGVAGLHHLNLWMMSENCSVLQCHLVVEDGQWNDADAIKARVKSLLCEEFGIDQSTIELECARHACADTALIDKRGFLEG